MENNDWLRFELQRLNHSVDEVKQEVQKISIDLAKLKIKSGIWGLLGGAIPIAIMLATWFIIEKLI